VNGGDSFSTGWYNVAEWQPSTTYVCGQLVRQWRGHLSGGVGTERVFVCYSSTGGTGTSAATEPAWSTAAGASTTDNTVKWIEVTGIPAFNGDVNTTGNGQGLPASMPTWAGVVGVTLNVGQTVISGDGTKILCNTNVATPSGGEPAWAAYTAAGATTNDSGGATWVTIQTAGHYSNLSAPFARLQGIMSANWLQVQNSQVFYVADTHHEWSAGWSLPNVSNSFPGMTSIISFDAATSNLPPGPKNFTTGKVQITNTGGFQTLSLGTISSYWYGISFVSGAGVGQGNTTAFNINGQPGSFYIFDNCFFAEEFVGTTVGQGIQIGQASSTPAEIIFNNCGIFMPNQASGLGFGQVVFKWMNTSNPFRNSLPFTGYSSTTGKTFVGAPTFTAGGTVCASMTSGMILQGVVGFGTPLLESYWEGVDLSGLSGPMVGFSTFPAAGFIEFKDCKLNPNQNFMGTWPITQMQFRFINCTGATGVYYDNRRITPGGQELTSTTFFRRGGAFDPNLLNQSRQYIPGSGGTPAGSPSSPTGPTWLQPLRGEAFNIWNNVTGVTRTVTVFGLWSGTTGPFNTDIWLDVEYIGGATGYGMGAFATNAPISNPQTGPTGTLWGFGATGTQHPTDTSVWTTGTTGYMPFKMQVVLGGVTGSFTPQLPGVITVRPKIGKTGTTFFLDPNVVLS
jgi:hypothetical protein